jgi:phosphoribosylanthranilate isomerase
VNGFVGITGLTCNWTIARKLVDSANIPVILAGGLSPDNVFNGIINVKPAGVDSCTQTNACDMQGNPVRFKKDMAKVKRFVEESRRAIEVIIDGVVKSHNSVIIL